MTRIQECPIEYKCEESETVQDKTNKMIPLWKVIRHSVDAQTKSTSANRYTTNIRQLTCYHCNALMHTAYVSCKRSNENTLHSAVPSSEWARNDILILLVSKWHYSTWWWKDHQQWNTTTLDAHKDHHLWNNIPRERPRYRRFTSNHEAANAAVETVVAHANITTCTSLSCEWL